MPTLTLKGLPDALYQELKTRATKHRRSLNSEILVCLESAIAATPHDVPRTLARIDAVRARLQHIAPLTDDMLTVGRGDGRR